MSQINAKHVNQISVNLVRAVKIRVHANHQNVNHANLAKTLAPVSLVRAVKVNAIVTVIPVLFPAPEFLWRMACGSLSKRYRLANMYRVLMASILYSAHKEPYLALVDVFGRSGIKASTSLESICSG